MCYPSDFLEMCVWNLIFKFDTLKSTGQLEPEWNFEELSKRWLQSGNLKVLK